MDDTKGVSHNLPPNSPQNAEVFSDKKVTFILGEGPHRVRTRSQHQRGEQEALETQARVKQDRGAQTRAEEDQAPLPQHPSNPQCEGDSTTKSQEETYGDTVPTRAEYTKMSARIPPNEFQSKENSTVATRTVQEGPRREGTHPGTTPMGGTSEDAERQVHQANNFEEQDGSNPVTLQPRTQEPDHSHRGVRTRASHRKDQEVVDQKVDGFPQEADDEPTPSLRKAEPPHDFKTCDEGDLEEIPLGERSAAEALQRIHLQGGDFPLPDSETWTARGEWSNVDIDCCMQQWMTIDPQVKVMPAKFILDAQRFPAKARADLRKVEEHAFPIHFILWIRHHWIAASLRGERLEIADSAPGIATPNDLRVVADFIGCSLSRQVTIYHMKVPAQPRNSVECGAHAVINLMLAQRGNLWERECTDNNILRVSYAELESIIKLFTDGELRHDFVVERIFHALGEARYPLVTHSRVLAVADSWEPETAVEVKWMGATQVHTWRGNLIKRKANHWLIKYDDDDDVEMLPHKNVCYLSIGKADWEHRLLQSHGDLLGLNLEPPSPMSKVEGDTLSMKILKSFLDTDLKMPTNTHFQTAYAPTTRKQQRQLITWIKDCPVKYDSHMCTEGLALHFTEMKKKRKWRNSTMLTKMAALQGTLKVLPFYFPQAPSVIMAGSIYWRTMMKGAQIAANGEEPLQAKPLTSTLLQQILLTMKETPKLYAALEIAWLTAGRVGDLRDMATRHVSEVAADVWMVKFQQGKTARNGAYSIAIPEPTELTKNYIRTCQTPYLFPGLDPEHLKEAMRRIDTQLECKSIRRGRLQELSKGGMTDASLLHISRHASISMLRRYLNFGLASGENIRRAHLAATATIAALSKERTGERLNFCREADPLGVRPPRTYNAHSPPSPTSSVDSFPSSLSE